MNGCVLEVVNVRGGWSGGEGTAEMQRPAGTTCSAGRFNHATVLKLQAMK